LDSGGGRVDSLGQKKLISRAFLALAALSFALEALAFLDCFMASSIVLLYISLLGIVAIVASPVQAIFTAVNKRWVRQLLEQKRKNIKATYIVRFQGLQIWYLVHFEQPQNRT